MTRRKLLTLLLAFTLVLSCACAMPVSAYAEQAPVSASVSLSQSFSATNNHPPEDGDPGLSVTYALTPSEGQDGSVDRTALSLTGDQSGSFNFTFTHGGEYVYTVRPQVQAREFFTYDESEYTIRVYVRNEADGTLFAIVTIWTKNADGTEVKISGEGSGSDLTYEHEYDLKIVPLELSDDDDPIGQKVISGDRPADAAEFNFTFRPVSMKALNITTQPMPTAAGSENSLTVSRRGAGEVKIGSLTFTEPGTYVYQISENNDGVGGYTYDTRIYYITYEVTLSGAVLSATRTITLDGEEVDVARFDNRYTTPAVVTYTISFAWTNNPVPGALPNPPAPVTVAAGSRYTPANPANTWIVNQVAPNGTVINFYVFQGWNPATIASVNANTTVYGTWVLVPNTFSVTYTDGVADETIFPDQVVNNLQYGAATPAFNGTPTREGYTFQGWAPAVSPTVVGTVTYVAQWAEAEEAPPQEPEPPAAPPAAPGEPAQEEILEEEVPLAAPGRAWALVNLLSAIATLGIAGGETYSFGSKSKKLGLEPEEKKKLRNKLTTWAPGIGSVVAFFLTEDITAPMTYVDKWTIMMVGILAVNGVLAYLTRYKKMD